MKINLQTNKYLNTNNNFKQATSFKSQQDFDLFIRENPFEDKHEKKEPNFFTNFLAIRKINKIFKEEGLLDNKYQYNLLREEAEEAILSNPVKALNKLKLLKEYPEFKNNKYLITRTFLGDETFSTEGIKQLLDFSSHVLKTQSFYLPIHFFEILKTYEDFNSRTTVINQQQECIQEIQNFERSQFNPQLLQLIPNDSELGKYSFIKDVNEYGIEEVLNKLQNRITNSYVKAIPVDKKLLEEVDKAISFNEISDVLNSTNLNSYFSGIPLRTSRNYFISHFKDNIKNLSKEDKKQIFDYFHFLINKNDDIIHYPILPDEKIQNASKEVEIATNKCRKLVNDYMYNNEVILPQKDYKLSIFMNKIIKAFPEFIPQIGKMQHRGDTMDFHVLDDLKRIVNNPKFKNLKQNEQKIMAYATLFHDFSKPENKKDPEHPFISANYTNDILKKTSLNNDDKERIYNLIRYSHWMTDKKLDAQDVAVRFRRPNDFKMAQIFAKADCESANFVYPDDQTKIDDIKFHLQNINSMAIPLFADGFPNELKNYEVSSDGIKYIDFSDFNSDVSKYGFKEGTKVKDLKFLFHSFNNTENLDMICNRTKEVCLSATFLPFEEVDEIKYNGKFNKAIISVPNSNIALAGKEVMATGKKKNINDFADFILKNNLKTELFFRNEFSSYIKDKLELSEYQYAQLYEFIGNLSSLDDIKHANLFNNKHLLKDEIIDAIKYAQDRIVYPIEDDDSYPNEVDVINPNLEAFVIPKEYFLSNKKEDYEKRINKTFEKIKEICKKRDIPMILV